MEIFRVSKLDDISFVNKLTGLEKLELVWLPHITKLPDLSSLYQLEEVKIDSLNGLTDISALINVENLKKVKMLNVKSMTKESIYAVLDNPSVEELVCYGGRARISDIRIFRKKE